MSDDRVRSDPVISNGDTSYLVEVAAGELARGSTPSRASRKLADRKNWRR